MIRAIYLDARLDKQLEALSRSGKKALLAAERAHEVVNKLQAGLPPMAEAGSITKHGELRIKGCIKYDLGGGYRLVTFKQDPDLYLLYVGSHDDCHRWIENNRELTVADIQNRSRCLPIGSTHADDQKDGAEEESLDRKDTDDSPVELDDRQLRSIFSGLIQSVQNNASSSS